MPKSISYFNKGVPKTCDNKIKNNSDINDGSFFFVLELFLLNFFAIFRIFFIRLFLSDLFFL